MVTYFHTARFTCFNHIFIRVTVEWFPVSSIETRFSVLTPLPLPGAHVSLHGYKGVRGPHPHAYREDTTTPTHTATTGNIYEWLIFVCQN